MGKNILISIIKPSRKNLDSSMESYYYEQMRDVAKKFIDEDINVTLMSCCDDEGDGEAIKEIINFMPNVYKDKIKTYSYKSNIEEALILIADSDYIIAVRQDTLIMGFVLDKNIYPIIYSDEMLNTLLDMQYKGQYADLRYEGTCRAEEIYNMFYEDENKMDISQEKENSEKAFERLDRFIEL